ncbi:MAG: triose-phosphate isomerase [Bacteroidales bacterium]|nr:triose-phosphate isomerase [Bacteroidales bacterium]
MKIKMIAANWKMNTDLHQAQELAENINNGVNKGMLPENVNVVLGVPYTHLYMLSSVFNLDKVSLAAQNCAAYEKGAYTGEVSAEMIKSTGAKYVILGHSERRTYFNETDDIIAKKIDICIKNDLKPIFCCGETLEERESGQYKEVIKNQVKNALFHIDKKDILNIVIAYEPVWAIGTGLTATPEQAQEIHEYIRQLIAEAYNNETANSMPILYGGSCNPTNAESLFAQKDINGGLIGGASLKHDDFFKIMNSF